MFIPVNRQKLRTGACQKSSMAHATALRYLYQADSYAHMLLNMYTILLKGHIRYLFVSGEFAFVEWHVCITTHKDPTFHMHACSRLPMSY
jgi:hypothetical protein